MKTMKICTEIEQCSRNFAITTRVLTHTHHATSFFTNGVVVIVRAVIINIMILFTVMIGVMWRIVKPQMDKNDEQTMASSARPALSDDENFKAVCGRYREYLNEHATITKRVTPINKIFRSFFVLQ